MCVERGKGLVEGLLTGTSGLYISSKFILNNIIIINNVIIIESKKADRNIESILRS
jgi:hypothetical protein